MSDAIEWPGYNNTLVDRGKLTFWIPENIEKVWYSNEEADRTYSDRAIEVLSVLRFKFGLTLREVEGFASSIFEWMGLQVTIPNYSTLCRRLGALSLVLWQKISPADRLHIVVDCKSSYRHVEQVAYATIGSEF